MEVVRSKQGSCTGPRSMPPVTWTASSAGAKQRGDAGRLHLVVVEEVDVFFFDGQRGETVLVKFY